MTVPRDNQDWIDWNRDTIIERDLWCVFCREELVRSRNVPGHWRHLDNGLITCLWAFQRGLWPSRRKRRSS